MKYVMTTLMALSLAACTGNAKKITSDFKKVDKAPAFAGKVIQAKDLIASSKKADKKAGRKIASADGRNPNSIHYSDHSAKPETGRSGERQIQTLALLGKDGKTTIMVSTGNVLAGTTEAGTHITKLQIKSTAADGTTVFNQELNNLVNNGTATFETDQLKRRQPITVQANVRKDGINRNFVVKTSNMVLLYPDLKAHQLSMLPQVYVNQPVMISATVSEINADMGATADCVLYVNNAETERATGIWVDVADSVTCSFNRTFATAGSMNIKVAVENVVPADYDTSNNSVTGTLSVVSNVQFTDRYAQAYDINEKFSGRFQYDYYNYSGSYNYDYKYQSVYYEGSYNQSMNTEGSTVTVSETNNGNTLVSFDNQPLSECYSYPGEYSYCQTYNYWTGTYAYLYSYTPGNTTYFYYSRWYYRVVYWGATGYYSYLNSQSYEQGTQFDMTSFDHTINSTVTTAANGTINASKTVTMQPYNYSYNQPWNCYWNYYCYEYSYTGTGKYGYWYNW